MDWVIMALLAFVLAWAWEGAEMRPWALVADSANMATYLKDFFPPDFKDWRLYLNEMVITLHIALWGLSWPFWLLCPWVCCALPILYQFGFISL
jgi:phosphonate transport system permease protein